MEILKVKVTPKIAQDWLTRNEGNRSLSYSVVMNYAIDMQEGKWLANTGETIKFAGEYQKLIDGQHRLQAVVLSETTQEMDIAINCNVEAFKVIDTGKKRNGSDIVSIEGFKHHALIAAGVRQYLLIKRNAVQTSGASQIKVITQASKKNKIVTNSEISEMTKFLNECYSVEEIARIGISLYGISVKTLVSSDIFSLVYLFSEKSDFKKVIGVLQSIKNTDVIIQYWKDMKLKNVRFTSLQIFNFHYFAMRSWLSGKEYRKINFSLFSDLDPKEYRFIF